MAKIAIFSFYSGIVERGVETFVQEIATRLAKKNSVTVFQTGNPKSSQRFGTIQIKSPISPPKSSKGLLPKFYLDAQSIKILVFSLHALPKFYKGKYQIAIILNGSWQTVIYKIASKITNTKILIPGEAGIGSDDAWNLLFRPDVFVALTAAQAKWAKKLQSEVRVENIPNGVDLSRFHPKVKPQDLDLPKPIIICTSALVPYKRVDLTIKAVAKTKNLSLLVLGDGEIRGQIDNLGKRLLNSRYQRLVIPYLDMPNYYRVGSIFTLASETEAFGTSYIEAMACNLPVVTTRDDSRAQIIGDAGILTDPTNTDQYAKDLELATKTNYKNKPYAQSLKFSWNKVAASYESLLLSLLKKN